MADLVKDLTETVFDNYTTTLGEAQDKVVVGNEKVVFAELLVDDKVVEYIEPTIRFTRWNEEESLTLSYPTPTGMTDKTLIDGEGLKLYGGAEDFYFNRYDDNTFKFGLILNEIPKNTQTWSFKLVGWENFDFIRQPPYTEEYKTGDIVGGEEIVIVTATQCLNKEGNIILNRPEKIVNGYVVRHKTKINHIIGEENYMNGIFGFIYRPKLIDSNGRFLGYADLVINNGEYSLSIANISQAVIDKAVLPLKFNDEFGHHPGDLTGYSTANIRLLYPLACSASSTPASNGTLTSIVVNGYSEGNKILTVRLYSNSGSDPNAVLDSGTLALTLFDDTWHTVNTTSSYGIVSGTQYWLAFRPEDDTKYICRYTTGGQVRQMNNAVWEDPWNTSDLEATWQVAVYANYTPSAGGIAPIYTKEILSSLPATAANLSTEFTEQEYTDVLTDDGNYVDLQ